MAIHGKKKQEGFFLSVAEHVFSMHEAKGAVPSTRKKNWI
jgi:hypothetical protein